MLPVFRTSEGDFVCRECSQSYVSLEEANACAQTHVQKAKVVAIGEIPAGEDIGVFKEMIEKSNSLGAAGKVCLMMVEDYLICRKFDLERSQRPGPLTMSFSKNAAEALFNLSKITQSQNPESTSNDRASDVDALKEMMGKFSKDEI